MENDELLGRLDERFISLKEHIDFRFIEQDKKIEHYNVEQKDKNKIIFEFINDRAITRKDLGITATVLSVFLGGIGFLWEKLK